MGRSSSASRLKAILGAVFLFWGLAWQVCQATDELKNPKVFQLASMGYSKDMVDIALEQAWGNVDSALNILSIIADDNKETIADPLLRHQEILKSWGFNTLSIMKALTDNQGHFQGALQELVHGKPVETAPSHELSDPGLFQLASLGYTRDQVMAALKEARNNDEALAILVERSDSAPMTGDKNVLYVSLLGSWGFDSLSSMAALAKHEGHFAAALRHLVDQATSKSQ